METKATFGVTLYGALDLGAAALAADVDVGVEPFDGADAAAAQLVELVGGHRPTAQLLQHSLGTPTPGERLSAWTGRGSDAEGRSDCRISRVTVEVPC